MKKAKHDKHLNIGVPCPCLSVSGSPFELCTSCNWDRICHGFLAHEEFSQDHTLQCSLRPL
uniref:Uncharacterized protein n=1 Tax=Oryza brachyantha TaxID=4533 RepID=J3MAI2_ORYBR